MLTAASTGYPSWPGITNPGFIGLDGIIWACLNLFFHGTAAAQLLWDERRISFDSDDDEQVWRFFLRRSGMGRLEMLEVRGGPEGPVSWHCRLHCPRCLPAPLLRHARSAHASAQLPFTLRASPLPCCSRSSVHARSSMSRGRRSWTPTAPSTLSCCSSTGRRRTRSRTCRRVVVLLPRASPGGVPLRGLATAADLRFSSLLLLLPACRARC